MHCAVIWARFGPYHLARLKAASAALAAHGGTVIGVEVARSDATYDWAVVDGSDGFERKTLFPGGRYEDQTGRQIVRAVGSVLDDLRPDAVAINGWSVPEARGALKWCNAKGVKAILMSESKRDDKRRYWPKEFIKRRLINCFDAAIVGGRPHRDYLIGLGFPEDRIFLGYDVVDNAHFAKGAARVRAEAGVWRTAKGLPEKYFFACTRFIARKNVDGLLRAYAAYRQVTKTEPWGLVIAGGGEEFANYQKIVRELNLAGVIWPGFVQYDDLPVYYGLASAFIHPAKSEPWGLVVNEAIASGLPVLSSRTVGSRFELVEEGHNGFLFDPFDSLSIADVMFLLTHLEQNRLNALAHTCGQIAGKWSASRFGDALVAALQLGRMMVNRTQDQSKAAEA